MGKSSTLIYLFSNFDESELISNDLDGFDTKDFDHILEFIEKNTKKVPDRIVSNIIQFAKDYS